MVRPSEERIQASSQRRADVTKCATGVVKVGVDRKVRKRYRFKPGTVIRRQIRKLQRTTNLLVPAAPFARLVREIAQAYATNGVRFETKALEGLHVATEDFLTEQFRDAERNMHLVTNGKRQTLNPAVLRSTVRMKYGNLRV